LFVQSDFSVSLRDYGQSVYAHFAVRTRMTFADHSHHSMGGLNASVGKAYVSTLLVILLMRGKILFSQGSVWQAVFDAFCPAFYFVFFISAG